MTQGVKIDFRRKGSAKARVEARNKSLDRTATPVVTTSEVLARPTRPANVVAEEHFFEITRERGYIPLCDLLHASGVVDSGGAGKHMVAEGDVSVDGVIELRKTCKIRHGQVVTGYGFVIKTLLESDD